MLSGLPRLLLLVFLAACVPPATPPSLPGEPGPTPTLAFPTEEPLASLKLPAQLPPWNALDDKWGPYLSEREWGNPRESIPGQTPWEFDFERAVNTAYRFGEDGIAGISDLQQEVNFSLAFWDERQPWISERLYGLSNPQGEFGEEIREQRVFWENTPTHSYLRYEYRYPGPEPLFDIQIEYAKWDSRVLLAQIMVTDIDPRRYLQPRDPLPLHVLPEAWFHREGEVLRIDGRTFDLPYSGGHFLVQAEAEPQGWQIVANQTGRKGQIARRLLAQGRLSNRGRGNKATWDFALRLRQGDSARLRFVLVDEGDVARARSIATTIWPRFDETMAFRSQEARALYRDQVTEYQDLYQYALMNLLWNKMYYAYDGSYEERYRGRLDVHDVVLVPDKWEFPWFAAWDTAFQAGVAARADPELAKEQLRIFLSDRWQQPDGHVPCVEWALESECPPLFGWAAWEIYRLTGDRAFQAEIFPRLEAHYIYFLRSLDGDGDFLYGGGPMGMDNLPRARPSEQADSSAWMAFFARHLALIAEELGDEEKAALYEGDYDWMAQAINEALWHEEDGFYYDLIGLEGNEYVREKSYAGLIPLIAGVVPPERVPRVLAHLKNPAEFWSDYGVRSLSRSSALYAPGYGHQPHNNSNWRGPIWLPINYLLVQALQDHDPALAEQLRENLIRNVEREWRRTGHFFEYYHGETGEGLGADHQTGWTALVAALIAERWGH